MVGEGGPPLSPLPDTIPGFVVPLPLPVAGRTGIVTEVTVATTKVNERAYLASGEWMVAAEYEMSTELGSHPGAVVVNARSTKVTAMVTLVVRAAASKLAIFLAYSGQRPPLPLPPNPGYLAPFSREAAEVLDGTARFRGFCAGLRSLDPALVGTVDVYVPAVFADPLPPPS